MAVPRVEEKREGEPEAVVLENALRKARAVLALRPSREPGDTPTLVLGVDTDVALDGRLLGKPSDEAAARVRLEALSGRSHEVLGGVALLEAAPPGGEARERTGVARTRVGFRRLSRPEIERYLASGEWRDRAGAYAIQGLGSSLVADSRGDLSNVIGLPIGLLLHLAPEFAGPTQGAA